jgi:hypothetical protein
MVYSSGMYFPEIEDPQPESSNFSDNVWQNGMGGRCLEIAAVPEFPFRWTSVIMAFGKLWKHVGWFDETPAYQSCEDYDFWLRAAKAGASFTACANNCSATAVTGRLPPTWGAVGGNRCCA